MSNTALALTVGTIGVVTALLLWQQSDRSAVTHTVSDAVTVNDAVKPATVHRCDPDLSAVTDRHDSTIKLLSARQARAIDAFKVSYASVSALDDREACRSIRNAMLDFLDAHRKRMVKAQRLPPLRLELSREAFAEAMPVSKFTDPVSLTRFLKMEVTSPLGESYGRIVDIELDPSTGRWTHFIAAKSSLWRASSDRRRYPIGVLRFDKDETRLLVFERKRPSPAAKTPRPASPTTTPAAERNAGPDQPPPIDPNLRKKIDQMPTRVLKIE